MSFPETTDCTLANTLDSGTDPCIVHRPLTPTFRRFGINQAGQLYEYGENYATPKRVLDGEGEGLAFLGIHDLCVRQRGGVKDKSYLDLAVGSLHPYFVTVLSLPIFNSGNDRSSWPVRTLLGSLTVANEMLDMRAMAGTICARRGTKPNANGYVANFIDLFVQGDPAGEAQARVASAAIDPDRHTLEITVDRLRRSLDFEPQFL